MADRGDVDEFGRQRGGRRSRSRSPDSDEDFRRRGTNRAPPSSAPATARPGTLKRGRSRSPPGGGGRSPPRGRRRSPTPPSKRRRPDEYDRRRSEPARGGRSAPLSATTLQQHRTRLEGPLMTFKEFALTEPDDVDPSTSITSYEKYKSDYHAKHAQTFFQARKGEQWFLDRYDRTRLASAYITPSEFQTQTLTRYTTFVSQYKSTEVNFLTQNVDLHQNITGVDVERKERFVDNCIQVVGLPSRITKEALVQLFSSVSGFSHLYLSPIDTTNNKFQRTAYVFYTSQEQTSKAFDQYDFYKLVMTPNKSNNIEGETESKTTTIPKLNGALQPIVLRLRPNPSRISHHMAPFITMEEERIQRDLEQATQLAKVLDKERSIEENVIFQDGTIHGLTPTLKQLNLVLYYLRSVHHYCYYCHQQYYSTESMFHACGMIHDRDTKGPSTDADQEFVTSLDNAIAERLITTPEFPSPPPPVDQAIVEKHVEEYYNNTIKKKAENKFKCNSCAKMFKSAEFVRKHIAGKHQNEISQAEAKAHEEMMYDLYMADEHRPSDIVTSTGVTKRSRSRSPRRRTPSRSRSRSRERRPRSRSRSPYYERHGVPVIDSGLLPPTSIVPAPPGAPLLPTPQGYYPPPPPPHMPYGGQYGPPMMPPHVPPPHHMQHHPPPHHMPPPPHMHPHHPPPPPPHMMRPPPPPPAMTRLAPDPVAAGRRIKSYSDLDAPKENDFVPDYGAFPKKKTTFASLSKWTKKTPTKQSSTDGTTTTTTTENNQENDSNKTEDQEMTS